MIQVTSAALQILRDTAGHPAKYTANTGACRHMQAHAGVVMKTDLFQGSLQEAVEEAGEIGVQPLVARDELITKSEAGHEEALLQPEDGAEASAEVDTLHAGKADKPLGEAAAAANPSLRPLRLARHARHRLYRLRRPAPPLSHQLADKAAHRLRNKAADRLFSKAAQVVLKELFPGTILNVKSLIAGHRSSIHAGLL